MEKKEVQDLATLRNYVIAFYKSLKGKSEPASLTSTKDIAETCETIIRSMDDLLREHVKFD